MKLSAVISSPIIPPPVKLSAVISSPIIPSPVKLSPEISSHHQWYHPQWSYLQRYHLITNDTIPSDLQRYYLITSDTIPSATVSSRWITVVVFERPFNRDGLFSTPFQPWELYQGDHVSPLMWSDGIRSDAISSDIIFQYTVIFCDLSVWVPSALPSPAPISSAENT